MNGVFRGKCAEGERIVDKYKDLMWFDWHLGMLKFRRIGMELTLNFVTGEF